MRLLLKFLSFMSFMFFSFFIPSLVPAFSEFLVPVVFTSFKPFLLKEKKVPPTLVIIRRLGFQSPFFTQIKTSSFHRLFFCFFSFLPSAKYPRVLLKKAVLFYVFLLSLLPSLVSKKAYRPKTNFSSGE